MLDSLESCYDPNLNPQISITYSSTSRNLHYFLREKLATYDESFFSKTSPLKGKKPTNYDLHDALENMTIYVENKCGITHGTMDTGWNLAGNGPRVGYLAKF